MSTHLQLGDVAVEVVFKDIKNVHLTVHPPSGRVHISAPKRMTVELVRLFAISKLAWIKVQQRRLLAQERETPREYVDRESHYLWGKRFLLMVVEHDGAPFVVLKHNKMLLHIRPGTETAKRRTVVEKWYRAQLKEAVPPVVEKWERLMGVEIRHFFIQRMKTKWGSCNPAAKTIRLNTDLAKKPQECLEYIVVHEMTHLLEPTHNARFIGLMDHYLPKWHFHRALLNGLPVRHETWEY